MTSHQRASGRTGRRVQGSVAPWIVVTAFLLAGTGCSPPELPEDHEDDGGDDTTVPRDVERLRAIPGDGKIGLCWDEWGEGSVDYVLVTWSPGGEAGQDVQAGACRCVLAGLTNGTEYVVTVRTVTFMETASEGVKVTCIPTRQRLYGGSGDDQASAITRIETGEYVIAGATESDELQDFLNVNGSDVYLVRFDAGGTVAGWTTYGSLNDEVARDIHPTSSDGYVVCGDWEVIAGEGDDLFALNLDVGAERVFERAPGGSGHEEGHGCLETLDGGFVFVGESFSSDINGLTYHLNGDGFVVKFNPSGATVWQQMFGGTGWDRIFGVVEANDGSLVIAGSSYSPDLPGSSQNGIDDFYLAKLDIDGTMLWQYLFGGTWGDALRGIDTTSDNGYIVAGYSGSSDLVGLLRDDGQAYVARLDAGGSIVWHERLGGETYSLLLAVQEVSDGGFIAVGYAMTALQGTQSYVVKLASDGTVEWQRWFGGSGDEVAQDVIEGPPGCYIVAGWSDSTDIPGATNNGGQDSFVIILDPP